MSMRILPCKKQSNMSSCSTRATSSQAVLLQSAASCSAHTVRNIANRVTAAFFDNNACAEEQ